MKPAISLMFYSATVWLHLKAQKVGKSFSVHPAFKFNLEALSLKPIPNTAGPCFQDRLTAYCRTAHISLVLIIYEHTSEGIALHDQHAFCTTSSSPIHSAMKEAQH